MSAPRTVDSAVITKIRDAAKAFPPKVSQGAVAKALVATGAFVGVSLRTMRDLLAAGSVSDYVFGLFKANKISYSTLRELGQSRLDDATADFLGRAAVERGMSAEQLKAVKHYLKKGSSVAEALGKATGQIPKVATPHAERPVNVEALQDEIMRMGTQWRMKVSMAMDLLPTTTLEGKSTRMTIFKKTYELRHLVREQLAFIDQKVEQFLKEIETHAAAEAGVASRRELVTNGGEPHDHDPGDPGDHGEAHDPAVGSAEQAVQDPAQDD